jgi:hypothetical protein
MKYPGNPEIIADIQSIDTEGEAESYGDKIIGISVEIGKNINQTGEVTFDVRDFYKKEALTIRVQLADLLLAISSATLHANREK